MNKHQRTVVELIRSMGGIAVTIETGGIHNKVVFTKGGKRCRLAISRGAKVSRRVMPRTRSQLRRMLDDQHQHQEEN